MKFSSREEANLFMKTWAETSQSLVLAVVYDGKTYRVVEADEKAVFVILPTETIVDTIWTARGPDIAQFKVVNAYSVAFCYNVSRATQQTIRVPHGTTDLGPFLDEAMLRAHDTERWRLYREVGPTFVDAISHGEHVSPWKDGLPVPEAYSERGERPVVVVRKKDEAITNVFIENGLVHLVVVDHEGNLLSRESPAQCAALKPPCFRLATKTFAGEDLLHEIYGEILAFNEECSRTSKTDTAEVWLMFNSMRQRILDTVGEPPEPLPF